MTELHEQGFTVIPDVLAAEQIAAGRRIVADMLDEEPPAEDHAGPYFLWPRFAADPRLRDFYRAIGLRGLAASVLIDAPEEPDFAQVATTLPPWPHRPGGPHVDGLTPGEPDGRPGTFSLLAGVWLTDQTETDRGNLWVWPGTHLKFGSYLADRGADALTRLDEMNPGPYPKVDLGDPVQVTGTAGSVLFAHYLLAHNIGGHEGDERRETVYYRLRVPGHRQRWRDAVTNPLLELR